MSSLGPFLACISPVPTQGGRTSGGAPGPEAEAQPRSRIFLGRNGDQGGSLEAALLPSSYPPTGTRHGRGADCCRRPSFTIAAGCPHSPLLPGTHFHHCCRLPTIAAGYPLSPLLPPPMVLRNVMVQKLTCYEGHQSSWYKGPRRQKTDKHDWQCELLDQ